MKIFYIELSKKSILGVSSQCYLKKKKKIEILKIDPTECPKSNQQYSSSDMKLFYRYKYYQV